MNDIEEYDPKKTYKQASDIEKPKDASDFVKVLDSETGIYKYYIKMVEGHQGVAPGEKGTGSNKLVWQEIKVDWDAMSYYAKDDVVFYKSVLINKEVIGYIRAKKDIDLYNILPDDSIYNGKDYWKRLD
ncbi:MAG: hypothetical protein EOM50_16955 [Erysipelotrichia bacterium]|nr:hypothetical protein [Erysipelotrichia bacterium]